MSQRDYQQAAARADLCRLLAACYYQPGPEFLEEEVFGSMRTAARKLDPQLAELADMLDRAFRVNSLADLLVDYTRLFLNPSGPLAAPYESAWFAGRDPVLMQRSMDAVIAAYAKGGFEISDEFRDLPDHIAAELEFLYSLTFLEARALKADGGESEPSAEARRSFLQSHLGNWVGPFTDAIRSAAQTDFYRELAELTRRFVLAVR